MAEKLTRSEIEQYKQDGYLVLNRPTLPGESFARLQSLAEEKLAEAAAERGEQFPVLLDCPHWSEPRLFEWLMADEMLDLVEPLIGPDIAIFACHLLQKPPGAGKRVPWHEDSAYWNGVLEPMEVASVTIALEPSLPETGGMRVIPGSHRHGYSDYAPVDDPEQHVFDREILPEQFDESKAVDQVLQPNEAAVHDCRIIHSSDTNRGTVRRRVLTVRYFPATSRFSKDADDYFKKDFHIYLARGADRAGNTYGHPTRVQRDDPLRVYT